MQTTTSSEKWNQIGGCLFRCTRAYQMCRLSCFCFSGYLIGSITEPHRAHSFPYAFKVAVRAGKEKGFYAALKASKQRILHSYASKSRKEKA